MLILLGLILLVAVAAVVVAVLQTGADPVQVHAVWWSVHTNGAALFVAGAVSLLTFLLGLWALRVGLRRARKRHQEMKELRRRAFAPSPQNVAPDAAPHGAQPARPSGSSAVSTTSSPPRRRPDADDHFDTSPRE